MRKMKRVFISLLCLLLIGQNLSPVMFAEENSWEPGIIPENGSGMTENDNNMSSWTDAYPAQLGEKDLEWNTQDFYLVSGASVNAQQSWVNSQNDSSDEQVPQIRNAPSSPDNWPLLAPEWSKATITLSAENTNMDSTQKVFLVKAELNQPTSDTKIVVHIPENLTYHSYLISKMDDLDPVELVEIINKNGWKNIEVTLKDGLAGEFIMSTSISFRNTTAYQWQEEMVNAEILRWEESINNDSIIFKQVHATPISFGSVVYSMVPNSTKNITSRIVSRIWVSWIAFWYHSNVSIKVPLPDGISITWDVVCSSCKSTSYDPEENILYVHYTDSLYRGEGYFVKFTLHYDWDVTWQFVASEPVTAEWLAWWQVWRTYTWWNVKINVVEWNYSVEINNIYNNGRRKEFLENGVNVPLYQIYWLQNNGTLDIDNLEIELVPPVEVRVKAIQIPSISGRWWSWEWRKVEINYDTNLKTNLSKVLEATNSVQMFWWDQIWLSDEEYITRISINLLGFNSLDTFSYLETTSYNYDYWANFVLYWDVKNEHSDGTPIYEWEKLITQKMIKINWEVFDDAPILTTWTKVPYISDHAKSTRWIYENWLQFGRWDTIIKQLTMTNRHPSGWNGWEWKDPYLYLIVNNSLELDTDLSHWTTWANIMITSVEDITSQIYGNIGDAKVFKVSTETELSLWSARTIQIPYIVKPNAIPGEYKDNKSIYIAFDTWYYVGSVADSYWLLWPINENIIKEPYCGNPTFTIIWSSYWSSSRIKSSFDPNRKAWYDEADDSSISIITDNTSSTYRQIFYNESSEDMHNLNITIPLPQKNDELWSQWRWILSWEVTVKVLQEEEMNDLDGVDITYSSDWTNYQPYSSFTNPSQIKNIKLHIATWPAKSQVVVDADILATWNPADGQIAKITSEWTFWGNDFSSQIQAMVYHPAPKATITYSPSTPTIWGEVVATISFDQENVEITNNSWNVDYLFTQTGEFIYEWRSMRNITWTTLAKVTWILPEPTPEDPTPYPEPEPDPIDKYTIIFVDEDGVTVLRPATEYDYGTPALDIIRPSDPTKKWYKFIWWTPSITDVMWDVVYKATYKKDWWGWSWWWTTPKCEWDCECEWNCDDPEPEHGSPEEERDMHKWAYDNGLTIYAPWEDAKFDQPLTRQQMAKISSIFWADFLGQKADASEWKIMECSQYKDLSKSKWEMRWYVIQSCLMKNMWYEYDNVNYIPKFKPYDKLSVAQASVILSRMARWTKYVISPEMWYQWHMQAVYDHELIDDISDPWRHITRWEAFMMMYRLDNMMKSENID